MNATTRQALRAGIVFGVLATFLILIGFSNTATGLLAGFIKSKQPILNATLFWGILGIWLGSTISKKADSLRDTGLGSALAGGVGGIMVGIVALILGFLLDRDVAVHTYLSQMLPPAIRAFLMEQPAATASVMLAAIILVAAVIGGMGSYWIRQSGITKRLPSRRSLPLAKIPQPLRSRWVPLIIGSLAAIVIPMIAGQYWNYTLGTIGIYVLLGLGLNIVVGLAGLLDLGYVAFFAIGAYTMALLTAPEPHAIQWNFWAVLPLSVVTAATAGVLLGLPVLRMRGDYLAIVTLGFGEIIRVLSKSDLLTEITGGPKGVRAIAAPTIGGFDFFSTTSGFVYLILLAILLVIFVTRRLQNSHIGRAWIAMREDETVAHAMGIDVIRYKLLAFAIGAGFAGLSGALFASRNQFTGPEDHTLMVSINVVALIIVGGMGSIPGVIAGAFVLKGLPEILRQLESYRILTFGALLVVMMLIRPSGLIPANRRKLEVDSSQPTPDLSEQP